jgi:membrane protease YdiL (CAAX protease family)
MTFVQRAWHPAVTLFVLAMAVASLVTGNDLNVTLLLFAIAGVNILALLFERRRRSRSSTR